MGHCKVMSRSHIIRSTSYVLLTFYSTTIFSLVHIMPCSPAFSGSAATKHKGQEMDSIPIHKIDLVFETKSGITSQIIKILKKNLKGDK